MKAKRLSADTLIELALATLKRDILADASSDKRYAGAMIASALEIARREITTEGSEAQWQLLDSVYDDGEGTLDQLARDIRAGNIDENEHPDLAVKLRKLVVAELEVSNPRFLIARQVKTDRE